MEKVAGVVGRQTRKRGEGKLEMLGNLIGITTSIATACTVGMARGGAAAINGNGRGAPRRQIVRRTVIQTNRKSVATLIAALDAEKKLRAQVEAENARLREMVVVAQDAIDELMQQQRAA